MIYRLIFNHHKFLNFRFDEEQLEDILGEPTDENFDSFINYNNAPKVFKEIYTVPLNFNFSIDHKEDKGKTIADLCVVNGRLFLSQRAYDILLPLINEDGEFLSVRYQEGNGYFFTPLSVVDVDPKITLKNEWGDIENLGFNEKDVEKYAVFRTRYDGYIGLYCQDRVKQAIEDNSLTGLYITTDLANIFPEDRASVEKAN
ncbi:hypothetical protein [Aliikangiella sp. IMCC44359]|uniref:hypothetical protein n=1 Tax=Aliikangiella sp. IMCC44359 TaxID=3459125 RepID=UPI00403B238C